MARPNLGSKRVCLSCNAKFYDLGKDPAICPECGAAHPLVNFLKPRRAKPPAASTAPKRSAPKEENEDDISLNDEDDGDVEDLDDDSDLGEVVAGSTKKDGDG